jgi:hypothetical protein
MNILLLEDDPADVLFLQSLPKSIDEKYDLIISERHKEYSKYLEADSETY